MQLRRRAILTPEAVKDLVAEVTKAFEIRSACDNVDPPRWHSGRADAGEPCVDA
jgi:hypothetical protein